MHWTEWETSLWNQAKGEIQTFSKINSSLWKELEDSNQQGQQLSSPHFHGFKFPLFPLISRIQICWDLLFYAPQCVFISINLYSIMQNASFSCNDSSLTFLCWYLFFYLAFQSLSLIMKVLSENYLVISKLASVHATLFAFRLMIYIAMVILYLMYLISYSNMKRSEESKQYQCSQAISYSMLEILCILITKLALFFLVTTKSPALNLILKFKTNDFEKVGQPRSAYSKDIKPRSLPANTFVSTFPPANANVGEFVLMPILQVSKDNNNVHQYKIEASFQISSDRVKGICFHATKPRVVIGFYCGIIEIWDYEKHVKIAVFDGHTGVVRSVSFHPIHSMFVSGSDDLTLRIWDYGETANNTCRWILNGHEDFIRCVQYHHTLPLILSCADDLSIRVWHSDEHECLAILKGHKHYVMCATFHSQKPWIVSCSMDGTIKLWDFSEVLSGLMEEDNGTKYYLELKPLKSTHENSLQTNKRRKQSMVSVPEIAKMTAHDKGCTFIAWHPQNDQLCISSSEDSRSRVWRIAQDQYHWKV